MYNGKENASVNAKCPFFKRESRKSITCEGFSDLTELKTVFIAEEVKDFYIRENCSTYPDCNCEIRKALERKYS